MENNKLVHRSITWYLWKREKHAAEIHRELVDVCGDGAPSDRTVRRWLEDFKEGKSSPEDEQSPGRPATATTTENIAVIKNLISDDPRITVTELSTATGNSVGTIWGILHDHLNLSKLTCRWIPKLLTADMKPNRVDISRMLLNNTMQLQVKCWDNLSQLTRSDSITTIPTRNNRARNGGKSVVLPH